MFNIDLTRFILGIIEYNYDNLWFRIRKHSLFLKLKVRITKAKENFKKVVSIKATALRPL